eukprot:705719-Hanusia_phi.AAC.2
MASPSASCVGCPAGLYTSGLGQTSCSSCAPGYYGSADSSCSPCPPGASSPAGSKLVSDCTCQYGEETTNLRRRLTRVAQASRGTSRARATAASPSSQTSRSSRGGSGSERRA